MSQPRPVIPGTTYHITRRCRDRQFFLRPGPITRSVVLYLLAIAARRYALSVHAVCAMSDHLHLVLTCREGKLPLAMAWLLPGVTKALNELYEREGAMWSPDEPTYWRGELADDASVFDAIVYTLANPVKAGLVRKSRQWTGACEGYDVRGTRRVTIEKLEWLFPGPWWPDRVELEIERPEVEGGLSDRQLGEELGLALAEREREIERERGGRRAFLGAKKAERVSWRATAEGARDAKSRAAEPGRERGRPREVLCRDPKRREELEEQYALFRRRHESARLAFERGERDVEFPAGTFLMKERFGVRCAQAP